MTNISLIISLINDALASFTSTIVSIDTNDNQIIFKTPSGDYTVTIPIPQLGIDKIEIENKNLKITYNNETVEILDLSFLKGDKGDIGIPGDILITNNLINPTEVYGGEWILQGISGSAYTGELLIDFQENGRINFNYSISTTQNYVTIDFPFQLAAVPFAIGTGILNSKSVNIIGIKEITPAYITANIPMSGKGNLSIQGLYKNIGTDGLGNIDLNILTEMNAAIRYHWRKVE